MFRPVVAGDKRPANRLVLPTPPNMTLATALKELAEPTARGILESHGIPLWAWHRLREGGRGGTLFVDDRTELLAGRLRDFAAELQVPLTDGLVGIADEDTE
ncbi:hypothetical protein GCM10022225_03000 [Plantactinospora mayteni]|uniref:Uncharacterized protein n=1 Tax=Plantactinospora mayteni TaxID=566021 RepID=A0ABQ4EQ52_9ACTN|nr:hypothetical protein [Plantactinospora mayteni]GIG96788.1 hypothetical protein Pma05_33610 [Plantactinospora mayteni]